MFKSYNNQFCASVRRVKGFTLIELMITIAILAIIMTMGVPSMNTLIKNNRIKSDTHNLVGVFSYARAEAAKLGAEVVVTANNATGNNEWGGGMTVTSGGTTLRVLPAAHASMTFDSDDDRTAIAFKPSGMTKDDAGAGQMTNDEVITICDDRAGETGRVITMLVSGIMNVQTTTCL